MTLFRASKRDSHTYKLKIIPVQTLAFSVHAHYNAETYSNGAIDQDVSRVYTSENVHLSAHARHHAGGLCTVTTRLGNKDVFLIVIRELLS